MQEPQVWPLPAPLETQRPAQLHRDQHLSHWPVRLPLPQQVPSAGHGHQVHRLSPSGLSVVHFQSSIIPVVGLIPRLLWFRVWKKTRLLPKLVGIVVVHWIHCVVFIMCQSVLYMPVSGVDVMFCGNTRQHVKQHLV